MPVDCFPEAPQTWPRCTFSEVALVNPRYEIDKAYLYPFVEMASIAENFRGITRFDYRKAEGSGLSRFKQNDILFGKITPCPENGKIALVKELPDKYGLGSTELIVLSPFPEHDPRYLFAVACSTPVRGRAVSRMEGSTGRLRVTEDTFTRWLKIAVPLFDEQQRIADVLDTVDQTVEHTHLVINKAMRLKLALYQKLLPPWIGFKRDIEIDGCEIYLAKDKTSGSIGMIVAISVPAFLASE